MPVGSATVSAPINVRGTDPGGYEISQLTAALHCISR